MTDRKDEHRQQVLDEIARLLQADDRAGVAERGMQLCETALTWVLREDNRELWGRLHYNLGSFATALGYDRSRLDLLHRAIDVIRQAQSIFTSQNDDKQWGKLQHNLAMALSYLGELSGDVGVQREAVAAFKAALAVFDRDTSPAEWALTISSLGSAHLRFGVARQDEASVAEAAECYNAALQARRATGATEEAAMATYNIGLCHATRAELTGVGDWHDTAVDHYNSYRELMDRTNRPREWANASDAIAMAQSSKGALAGDPDLIKTAIAGFETILETMTRTDHPAWWAMVTINLCQAQVNLGELESDPSHLIAATERAAAALEIATESEIPTYWTALTSVRADARLRLGRRLGDASQLQRAVDELTAVLNGRMRTPADQATAAHLRGNGLLRLGVLDEDFALLTAAIESFDRALSNRSRDKAPVPWAQSLIGRGDARRELGMRRHDATLLAGAIADFTAALDVYRTDTNSIQSAEAASGRGQARLALWRLERDPATAMLAERDFAEAERLLDPALDSVAMVQIRRGRANAALLAGMIAEAANVAEDLLDDAAGMLAAETIVHEQLRLADALTGVGDVAAYAHAHMGNLAAAIAAHDRGRAHRLRGRLRLAEITLTGKDRQRLETGRRSLERARRALAAALEAERPAAVIARLATALNAKHASFQALAGQFGLTTDPEAPTLAELHNAAGDGAIVVPVVTLAGGLAIVISADEDTIDTVPLPELTEMALELILTGSADGGWLGAYRRFRERLSTTGGSGDPAGIAAWNGAIERTLEHAWRLLMQPLDRHLRERQLAPESEIVMVPGGRLAMLPLHVAGTSDARFLDRWSVVYAPSLSARMACWRRSHTHGSEDKRLLAITDPHGDLGARSNPATDFFPPERTDAFAGSEARRAAVMTALPQCSHASFFTHAWWDPDRPERSHIELAAGEKIEARDFAELDLGRTRLVVLGACESGVPGGRIAPDEFQGMPASLIEAGVPGVVATLWPVFNRAAEIVLGQFFQAHVRDGLPPAVALRRAQIALRDMASVPPPEGSDSGHSLTALGLRPRTVGANTMSHAPYDLSQPAFWAAFAYSGA